MEPVVVEIKVTYQDMKKFMWFTMFRKGKGLKPAVIVMIIVYALAFLMVSFMLLTYGMSYDINTLMMLTVLPVLLVAFLLMPTISAMIMRKTSKILFETTQRYTFTLEDVQIVSNGPNVNSSGAYRYDAFHKVCETKDSLYLFVSSNQALLISKQGMKPADHDDLSKLLQQKLGKKYIICY